MQISAQQKAHLIKRVRLAGKIVAMNANEENYLKSERHNALRFKDDLNALRRLFRSIEAEESLNGAKSSIEKCLAECKIKFAQNLLNMMLQYINPILEGKNVPHDPE